MSKLLGVILAFILCTGVWFGGLGAFMALLWIFGYYPTINWALAATLVAVGAISVLLIQTIEKKYPYKRSRIIP